jgi:hypothetical protein
MSSLDEITVGKKPPTATALETPVSAGKSL